MSMHTIGDLAREAGVSVETLRFYEREGLIAATVRSARGWRRYGADAPTRIRFIKGAQRLGFSLAEIRSLLLRDGDARALCAATRAMATRKIAEIRRRVRELEAARVCLESTLAECDAGTAAAKCPAARALRGGAR